MDKSTKTTLVTLPSGTIDLVLVEGDVVLQFNTTCLDALPYCHAMCCRNRDKFNVPLEPDEVDKFKSWSVWDWDKNLYLLQYNDLKECTYLCDDLCMVHDDKPRGCSKWHCSPEGKGEGITIRANGWTMSPKMFTGG